MKNYITFSTVAFMAAMILGQPGHSREQYQPGDQPVCESIAHILNDLYIEGHVDRDEALGVISTCFEYYDS